MKKQLHTPNGIVEVDIPEKEFKQEPVQFMVSEGEEESVLYIKVSSGKIYKVGLVQS